ncbi:DUF4296 domain-containing protein [Tenacibaculum amylolyticum]|uniref:DUF4296 domain-containing protein n=1 Tax=Tenacibaculum amylolyticum TaxID=104269 RepID=UPI003894AF93
MKSLRFIIPILICCLSCTGNTIYKKPEGLIPRDSMIMLLSDMHIATAAKYTKNKFQKKNVNYMPFIYEKYKIDSTRFDISNTYYTSRIDEYDELINDVKKRLEEKGKIIQKELNIADSIKKIALEKQKLDSLANVKMVDSLLIKESMKDSIQGNIPQKEEEGL